MSFLRLKYLLQHIVRHFFQLAVSMDPVECLVRRRTFEPSEGFDIRAQLYEVQGFYVKTLRRRLPSRIPGRLQMREFQFYPFRHHFNLLRSCIPSHEAHTGYRIAVLPYQPPHQLLRHRFPGILPQPGAVTPGTMIGAPRNIDCQGHLLRHLLADNIV